MAATKTYWPGFTALSDQIFVRQGSITDGIEKPQPAKQPRVVIIFAWGDAQPKHVAKYADGFRHLYPDAKQIAVLSPIYKSIWRTMAQRIEAMKPVLDAAFPSPNSDEHNGSVLVHVMSNTGGIAYAATLHAYRNRYGRPLPHRLVTLDSTPGSTKLTFANLRRLALAMALGTASWFPWPFFVTKGLWGVFLFLLNVLEKILGRESAGAQSVKAFGNPELSSKQTRRLYLYGKEDRIILYTDIEENIAGARASGWKSDARLFEGSGHVEHMRKNPAGYWKALQDSWEEAIRLADS
ncbi:TMEM53 family protein [Aspergillus lucknowensis]|uniref:DUF829-domain-containing protein n=1 Tax=Aspergillus lucknowensis TaxID=176173 RepID=A0ABR4L8V0_9EURO